MTPTNPAATSTARNVRSNVNHDSVQGVRDQIRRMASFGHPGAIAALATFNLSR